MKTFALIAYLVLNGQVEREVIDSGLAPEDCAVLQAVMDEVYVSTEADFVPLACEAEWEA